MTRAADIARAWASLAHCVSCLRERSRDVDWDHPGGCKCERCASLCWGDFDCGNESADDPYTAQLARAYLAALELLRETRTYVKRVAFSEFEEQDAAYAFLSRLDRFLTENDA